MVTRRRGIEVLVGDTATVDLTMSPPTLAEMATVTGESPLIEIGSSEVSINIHPRQIVCGWNADRVRIASVKRTQLDGRIIPRPSLVGEPIYRSKLRLQMGPNFSDATRTVQLGF